MYVYPYYAFTNFTGMFIRPDFHTHPLYLLVLVFFNFLFGTVQWARLDTHKF